MDWTTTIALLTAGGLAIYLACALLLPEIFE